MTIKRIRTDQFLNGDHLTADRPFVLDTRSHDIPNTIGRMIRALPQNCIALSLRIIGGPAMIRRSEREARRRGIRVIWL